MLNYLGYNEEFSSTYDEFVGDFCSDNSEDAIKDDWKVCVEIGLGCRVVAGNDNK
jgi:hypothetical protein